MPTVTGTAASAGTGAAVAGAVALGFISLDADTSAGGWTNQAGGTPLYPSIDEHLTSNDADYILSSGNPSSDLCKISLSNPVSGGVVGSPLGVSYRYGKSGTSQIDLVVSLMQGGTSIASWTHTNVSATPTSVRQVLTTPQFNSITDFTNLYLTFQANRVAAYAGPGDVVSGAAVYCGLRAYTAASVGSNVVAIRRSSDSATKTFVSLTNGGIDTADAFFDGSTYAVVTLYDQTGNGNDLNQPTAAQQPLFLRTAGSGGRPCIQFITANNFILPKAAGATHLGSQPNTGSVVFNNTGGSGNVAFWAMNDAIGGNTAYNLFGVNNAGANTLYLYAGAVFEPTCSDGAWHSAQGLFNSTSSILMIDGTSNTGGNAGTQPGGLGQLVMGDAQAAGAGGTSLNGYVTEAIWWSGDKSANFAALTTNQRAYWSF